MLNSFWLRHSLLISFSPLVSQSRINCKSLNCYEHEWLKRLANFDSIPGSDSKNLPRVVCRCLALVFDIEASCFVFPTPHSPRRCGVRVQLEAISLALRYDTISPGRITHAADVVLSSMRCDWCDCLNFLCKGRLLDWIWAGWRQGTLCENLLFVLCQTLEDSKVEDIFQDSVSSDSQDRALAMTTMTINMKQGGFLFGFLAGC